jgi:hypothetical protein
MEFISNILGQGAAIYLSERNIDRDRQEREAQAERNFQLSLRDKAAQNKLVIGLVASLVLIGGIYAVKRAKA